MLNFFFKDYNEMGLRQAKAAWMVHTRTHKPDKILGKRTVRWGRRSLGGPDDIATIS